MCNVAVGYSNFDLAALTRAGVLATNTPGVLDDTTADLAQAALLMATARYIVPTPTAGYAGNGRGWKFRDPWWARMCTAPRSASSAWAASAGPWRARAAGFDMPVIYHNRTPLAPEQAARATQWTRPRCSGTADFIVLLLPYSPATHHSVGAAELALMKPSAHLINVARGGIVDDDALIARNCENAASPARGARRFRNEPAFDPRFCSKTMS